jgi:SAM-dependent methyltransferase
MFTEQGLHFVRQHEIAFLSRYFTPGARILEVGAGTGFQAKALSELGLEVVAIDLPASNYRTGRVFDVLEYDGRRIPFSDESFDVVFSSNVLEHVFDLTGLLAEMRRVLRPGGYCVHAMPTPTWRLWSALSGVADCFLFLAANSIERQLPIKTILARSIARAVPRRHGEHGNSLTELWYFRRQRWRNEFEGNGFEVLSETPMGLLYSGWLALGARWSLRSRERAARLIGSSARAYVVRPRPSLSSRRAAAQSPRS